MRVFHRIEDLAGAEPSSVVLGNFDGLHRGHIALLSSMRERAAKLSSIPSVLTFFPHPVEVLRPGQKLERLTTTAEKLALLEEAGVEQVLVARFDAELASLTPEAFFERFLLKGLNAASIHVGFNFRFGKDRAGDTSALAKLCVKHGRELQVEPPFEIEGQRVSSSAIRQLVRDGAIDSANGLLGRPYTLTGQVAQGDGRGHQLGFSTANLHVPGEKVLPKNGVYVTRAIWQKQTFLSVTNVGVRPTFKPDNTPITIETHLLDFSARLYDEFIEVQFLGRIRDEKKFASIDELKAQVKSDIATARSRS